MKFAVVTPWHNPEQKEKFLEAWGVTGTIPECLILQQDKHHEGCARTKNKGIRKAIDEGVEYVGVLDDDCYPEPPITNLHSWISAHLDALADQPVHLFMPVTSPPSRGTPYRTQNIMMPVAASMGFWTGVPDYDAPSQLVRGTEKMTFRSEAIHGRYFPLCGMNLAFRAEEWPWCQFVNVERMDDIWSGFLWQRKAYAEGKCFNLNGPTVRHVRQSNVFKNLKVEAENLERNETLWRDIATGPLLDYDAMLASHGFTPTLYESTAEPSVTGMYD